MEALEIKRRKLHQYVEMKLEERDYHAVADAAMDLRELQTKADIIARNPFEPDSCNWDKFNEVI